MKLFGIWGIWQVVGPLIWLFIFFRTWSAVGKDHRFEGLPDYVRELPSNLTPALVQTLMRDIVSEREDGKLRRMMTTPLRPVELIGARIAGGWVMGVAILLVMAAAGTLVFRVTFGPFGWFLLLGAVAAFWTAAFFALLHALVRNRNQAGALSAPIILAFSLFGGSMMNIEAMPKAFRTVGIVTPNRWFIDGAALVRDGRFPVVPLLVLLASGLVLLALAVPALRRRTTV